MTSPTPPARILVCDDDPAIAAMVAAILHREGYETLHAHDGPDCIALVEAQ